MDKNTFLCNHKKLYIIIIAIVLIFGILSGAYIVKNQINKKFVNSSFNTKKNGEVLYYDEYLYYGYENGVGVIDKNGDASILSEIAPGCKPYGFNMYNGDLHCVAKESGKYYVYRIDLKTAKPTRVFDTGVSERYQIQYPVENFRIIDNVAYFQAADKIYMYNLKDDKFENCDIHEEFDNLSEFMVDDDEYYVKYRGDAEYSYAVSKINKNTKEVKKLCDIDAVSSLNLYNDELYYIDGVLTWFMDLFPLCKLNKAGEKEQIINGIEEYIIHNNKIYYTTLKGELYESGLDGQNPKLLCINMHCSKDTLYAFGDKIISAPVKYNERICIYDIDDGEQTIINFSEYNNLR